jgi:hypothetical protein
MSTKRVIIILLVLILVSIVKSGQSDVQRGRIGVGRLPPGIPSGATHEGAFALALKDPNIYIGVFEYPSVNTKLLSGKYLWTLPDIGEATNLFSPLLCIKSIKGKFVEPVIWYSILPSPRGEGRPTDRNSSFILLKGSKCILAVKKATKEELIGRFGEKIEKYSYINENTFFDVLWYGYGALYLQWPEGKEKPSGVKQVPESMVDDLEAIAKVIPLIQKETKDPNDTAAITKMSLSLKNDLAKSILEKATTEKQETPTRRGTGANRN